MIIFFGKNLNKSNSEEYTKMLNIRKKYVKGNQVTLLQNLHGIK